MLEASNKMSTQAKISQIKNNQNLQNSNQPLKFRSFDAFYQYYSKKQTYESSQHRNSISQQPITNTTLKDKKESSKNEKPTPVNNKPTFTLTTEDYNIKGRVKRLCEIFQKARKDINSRVNLENKISKNKTTKASKSPISSSSTSPGNRNNVVTYLELNTQKPKEYSTNAVQVDFKHKNRVEHTLNQQQRMLTNAENNNNNNNNTNNNKENVNVIGEFNNTNDVSVTTLTDESKFNTQFENNVENGVNFLQQSFPMEKNHNPESLSTLSTFHTDSFDVNKVPTMDELSNMLSTHRISSSSHYSKSETEGGFTDSSRSDNNALIDDILNRFMNDPDFCDTFFSKLENLNLYGQPGAVQFTRVLDELLFLVENENNNENSAREVSQEYKKDFEWFFNQPKVFNFNVTDRIDIVNSSLSPQPEELDQKFNMENNEFELTISNDEQIEQDNKDNNNNQKNKDDDLVMKDNYMDNNNNGNTNKEKEEQQNTNNTNNIDSSIEDSLDVSGDLVNEKGQTQVSSVLQQTNQNHVEYDLFDEMTEVSYELSSGHNADQEDECFNSLEEQPNKDLAKYFDWVKNQ